MTETKKRPKESPEPDDKEDNDEQIDDENLYGQIDVDEEE
jgi:hypothetical protein